MNVRHVRWGVWLAGLGFLIGCAAAPAVTPVVTGAPRLQVDKASIDLGDRQVGQMVSVSFEVTNVGDQPLIFTQPPDIEVVEGC
jgi:hypothetical protein